MLEWNSVGQFAFRVSPAAFSRTPPQIFTPNLLVRSPSARANAFQTSVRSQFVNVEALLDGRSLAQGSTTGARVSQVLSYLNAEVQKRLAQEAAGNHLFNERVFTLKLEGQSAGAQPLSVSVINEALRLLGFAVRVGTEIWSSAPRFHYSRFNARIYPGLRGHEDPLEWNSLGAPIELKKGDRYLSRWLVQLPTNITPNQPTCDDVLNSVRQVITAGTYDAGWPWQGLGAYNLFSQTPAGWPSDMRSFPFAHPGACLIYLDGVWNAPTTTVDSASLPTIPGGRAMDFRNGTTGQTLVDEPRPASPCDPASLTFDIFSGIFKCAGQVIQPTVPVIPLPPVNVPPIPVQPPIDIRPPPANVPPTQTTGEKKEKSVVPWLIGGALLIGGGVLLARAG